MSYTVSTLEPWEQKLFDLEKPILTGSNLLQNSVIDASWFRGSGGSGLRNNNVTYAPPSLTYDGFTHAQSICGASDKKLYLRYLLKPVTFDVIAIFNHNARSIVVRIADDNAMQTNARVVASWEQVGSRCVSFCLGETDQPQRFQNVSVIEIEFSMPEFSSNPAQVGEVWLGYRYPLSAMPNEPYERFGLHTAFTDRESASGLTRRYVRYRGQKRVQVQFSLTSDQEVENITDWWEACELGSTTFLYCESPKSRPHDTWLMMERSGALLLPKSSGPFLHTLSLEFFEQPPFNAYVTT